MRDLWAMQPRFERRAGKSPYKLLEHLRLRAGYDFLLLRCASGEIDAEIGAWWTEFMEADGSGRETPAGRKPKVERETRQRQETRGGAARRGRKNRRQPAQVTLQTGEAATQVTAYVGIGANLGDALGNVRRAILQLERLPATRLSAQSSLFRSAPVDAGGDDYVNAVVRLDTQLAAEQLLAELQTIEQDSAASARLRNAPRTLDLDLLLYGRDIIDSATLTVPHPRMTQRAFVLIPLLQIDPLVTIPGQGPAHAFAPGVTAQAIQKIA